MSLWMDAKTEYMLLCWAPAIFTVNVYLRNPSLCRKEDRAPLSPQGRRLSLPAAFGPGASTAALCYKPRCQFLFSFFKSLACFLHGSFRCSRGNLCPVVWWIENSLGSVTTQGLWAKTSRRVPCLLGEEEEGERLFLFNVWVDEEVQLWRCRPQSHLQRFAVTLIKQFHLLFASKPSTNLVGLFQIWKTKQSKKW